MVSVTLTAADIPGADLNELLVLFWHRYRESAWNKLATATSAASHPSKTRWTISVSYLDHLEIGGRRRSDPGLGCCHNMLQVCPAYGIVLVRASTDSHSLHTVFTARSLVKHHSHMNCVRNRYGFSHTQVSNCPLPICHPLQYLTWL